MQDEHSDDLQQPDERLDRSAYDLLLLGGHVLCMDETGTQYASGYVALHDGFIEAIGPAEEAPHAQRTIDCSGCAVLPGLINCHTHLPMVYFRGLADDLPLHDWLNKHIFPAEAQHLSSEFVYQATLLAAAECIRGGVTCVNDMYLFATDVARALDDSGLRGLVGEGVISFPTPSALTWQEGLTLTRELAEQYANHERIVPTACAHAPYTCDVELLTTLHAAARELGLPFHIHLHETNAEPGMVNWLEEGESPTAGLARIGVLDGATICAHCVWLDQPDIGLLASAGSSCAHCPQSNLKLASGVAPLLAMLKAGVAVGVGTDGAASNNNLSLWEELSLAALLAKGARRELDPTAIPARTALELATRRAAAALKQSDIGTLALGLRGDVIVVELSGAHLTPRYGHADALYSHLVYAAQAADVRDTIVQGRVLMRNRELLTLDEAALRASAQAWVEANYPAGASNPASSRS